MSDKLKVYSEEIGSGRRAKMPVPFGVGKFSVTQLLCNCGLLKCKSAERREEHGCNALPELHGQ